MQKFYRTNYSAEVKIELDIDGTCYSIERTGPGYVVLKHGADIRQKVLVNFVSQLMIVNIRFG